MWVARSESVKQHMLQHNLVCVLQYYNILPFFPHKMKHLAALDFMTHFTDGEMMSDDSIRL